MFEQVSERFCAARGWKQWKSLDLAAVSYFLSDLKTKKWISAVGSSRRCVLQPWKREFEASLFPP